MICADGAAGAATWVVEGARFVGGLTSTFFASVVVSNLIAGAACYFRAAIAIGLVAAFADQRTDAAGFTFD